MESVGLPRVSVLMSVYNGERFLPEAVGSILSQTLADFELIVVDDGSTDRTWSILSGYDDSRMYLLRNESNLGLARSLNRALTLARGAFIARMDADDVSVSSRLERQVTFLARHKRVGVVGSSIQIIDESGHRGRILRPPVTDTCIKWRLCFGNPIAHPSVMMRKKALQTVGGYDDSLNTSQDRDLWQRMGTVTQFANLEPVLLFYRKHPSQVSQQHSEVQAYDSARIGQRMIGSFLERSVPSSVCHGIQKGKLQAEDDVLEALEVLSDLYQAFRTGTTVRSSEERAIRDDAAERLVSLAWQWVHCRSVRRAFRSVAQLLGYSSVARATARRARKKAFHEVRARAPRMILPNS